MERYPSKKDLQEIWIPQEIWRDIFTRLPISLIMRCWSVCKLWHDLIEEDGRLAKQFMAFVREDEMGYAVADEDGQPLFRFELPPPYSTPHHRLIISSVNGLLLLWNGLDDNHDILFVVNPITCEYTELPPLPTRRCVYGFGVSKISGQYKILCVDESRFCHVYSLGGECSWRRIPTPLTTRLLRLPLCDSFTARSFGHAIFFNGNIHWVANDSEDNFLVCCFDLETELFTSFPLPIQPLDEDILIYPEKTRLRSFYVIYQLYILGDRLCVLDTSSFRLTSTIWKMDNYGDASSWIVEYTFASPILIYIPLKVLMNGDLMFSCRGGIYIYSKNTEACRLIDFLPLYAYYYLPSITNYIPSPFSLKTLGIHNVQSLCIH